MSRPAMLAALAATLALPLVLPLVLPLAAGAQKPDAAAPPRRPALAAGADTNDAQAYLAFGSRALYTDPAAAGDAFYWASRLEPGMPDALYARWVAWLLARPERIVAYRQNVGKFADSPEVRRVDSLLFRAQTADPLFYRRHDALLFRTYVEEAVVANARRSGDDVNRVELSYVISTWLKDAGPEMRGWQAYCDGRFDVALRSYTEALKRARKEDRADVHLQIARIFALAGNADSAVAHFQLVLADLRARESKKTVRWYDSKALLEQSIAVLHERAGHDSLAREAYGRALQEDLSYYPAHARLAAMALARRDTATAVAELDLAVQVKGDDPALRYQYGAALAAAGRAPEAVTHLSQAVELEPYYAAPHYLLGRIHEAYDMHEEAARYYGSFVARAAARDPLLADARARLAKLGAAKP